MNLDETKQALISLLQGGGTEPMNLQIKSGFHRALAGAETSSEVAEAVLGSLDPMYKAYGEAFLDIVRRSLSPEVWESQGILINPSLIPDGSLEEYFVVADGSVKTIQSINKDVTYYGNVDLIAQDGFATVMQTCHPVRVEHYAHAEVCGSTMSIVHDHAHVYLNDTSRAILEGADTFVRLRDRSFAECKQCNRIEAYYQSQFVVQEGAGLSILKMYQTARGALLGLAENYPNLKIHMEGEPLLYVPDKRGFRFDKKDKPCILESCSMGAAKDQTLSLVIPRYYNETILFSRQIVKPISIDKLKRELIPLLPNWDQFDQLYFEKAKDEREVCDLIMSHIPEMVQKGLTGDFLREHFTELTLNEHGIFTNYECNKVYPALEDEQVRYFFGDQNVGMAWSPFYAYEHALVAYDKNITDTYTVGQDASIILTKCGKANVLDKATCVAAGTVTVDAKDTAEVCLIDKATASAGDKAYVTAYDETTVTGTDQARLLLHDHARANVNDDTRTLALGENKINVLGRAEVAFATYDAPKPEINQLSPEATLRELGSAEMAQQYAKSLRSDLTKEVQLGNQRTR